MSWFVRILLIGLAILVFGGAGVAYYLSDEGPNSMNVTSFEECEAAGYPVGESHPRQCWTPDGRHFVEEIEPVAEFWGTAHGTVLLGPTCPVVRDPPDPDCADRLYHTRLAITSIDGARVIKEFESKEDGTFYVELPPGEYAIRSAAAANILPYCQSSPFTILPNGSAEVVVSCDTGIR